MEVERVPINSLKPHPRNPRQGDVGAISESLKAHGQYRPIVAQRSTSYILAGNHTWKAAKALKWKDIATVFVDVSDDEAYRILLVDNRSGDLADYDNNELVTLLQELTATELGLEGTGYDGDALDELLRDLGLDEEKPDPAPQIDRAAELREQWGTERGQVWAIPSKSVPGKSHRLMCGDSTSAEDVGRLLAGETPRLMVTDPPYGVEYDPEWRATARSVGKVTNDDTSDWTEAWRQFHGPVAYVWHAGLFGGAVASHLAASGLAVRYQIIWAKPYGIMSRGHYNWQHETCWMAVRDGDTAEWVGKQGQTTLWDGITPAKDPYGRSGEDTTPHSTQKPLECMARPIRNHRGNVYDPFLGSGTTMVAAENERRVCYGIEIDPGYCAVILQRMTDMGLAPHRVTRDEDNG